MSENVEKEIDKQDSLSLILRQLDFSARVFFRDGYCGDWAVDTSGSTHVPFHLVCEGEGWLHGSGHVPQKLTAGQLVFFPKDSPHILSASVELPSTEHLNRPPPKQLEGDITRLVCGYFKFKQRAAAPLLNSLADTMVLDLSHSGDAETVTLVNLWMREAACTSLGNDLAVDRLAELVFLQVLRVEIENDRLHGVIGALGDTKLGAVLAEIHRAPGAPHTLTAMAHRAGMSDSAFVQRFGKRTGMSPGQYVKHWRMQTAAHALIERDVSIYQIAGEVGYVSEVAFRKAFSAYFGIPPGRYRRKRGA